MSHLTIGRLNRVAMLTTLWSLLGPAVALGQSPAPTGTPGTSVFPPIILQGCAYKVTGNGSLAFPYRSHFDISFMNTTAKTAKMVMVRIGGTDFVKVGTFKPGDVASWRLDAKSFGTFAAQNCQIQAVRFEDGSEWTAPPPAIATAAP